MQQDPRSDHDLVAAANAGDARALEALYLRHRDWVHGLAWRWLGDPDAAWDVCQETFRYLLDRIPGLVLTARLRTFLWPVVRGLCRDRHRRAAREIPSMAIAPAVLDRAMGGGEVREALMAVLRSLTEAQREVVVLRFVDGFSLDEISHLVDVPLGTVKSRLHHALQRLRADPSTKKLLDD